MTARRSIRRGRVLWDYAARRALHALRHLGEIHRRAQEGRAAHPMQTHELVDRARAAVDRIAAGAGELRLRLRGDQEGHASRLDLGRHRHLRLLRARRSDASRSGAARSRAPGSAWRSPSSTNSAASSPRGKGELVCTAAVPVDAGRLLERSRRPEISRRLLRSLSRASGITATSPSGPSTAA